MNGPIGKVRHIRAAATAERSIITFGERDREARGKARDARDCPTTQQLARNTVTRFSERQVVAVADDKVMRNVERGKRPAQAGIERVDRVEEPGRVVDGFRPGVRAKDAKSSYFLLKLNLQSIVVGVGRGRFPGVVLEIEGTNPVDIIQFPSRSHGIWPSTEDKVLVS